MAEEPSELEVHAEEVLACINALVVTCAGPSLDQRASVGVQGTDHIIARDACLEIVTKLLNKIKIVFAKADEINSTAWAESWPFLKACITLVTDAIRTIDVEPFYVEFFQAATSALTVTLQTAVAAVQGGDCGPFPALPTREIAVGTMDEDPGLPPPLPDTLAPPALPPSDELKPATVSAEDQEAMLARAAANRKQVASIADRLVGLEINLETTGRTFLCEGDFTMHDENKKKGGHHWHYFLFNDMLIYGKAKSSGTFSSKKAINKFTVKKIISAFDCVTAQPLPDDPLTFKITQHKANKAHVVECITADDRKEFFEKLNAAVEDFTNAKAANKRDFVKTKSIGKHSSLNSLADAYGELGEKAGKSSGKDKDPGKSHKRMRSFAKKSLPRHSHILSEADKKASWDALGNTYAGGSAEVAPLAEVKPTQSAVGVKADVIGDESYQALANASMNALEQNSGENGFDLNEIQCRPEDLAVWTSNETRQRMTHWMREAASLRILVRELCPRCATMADKPSIVDGKATVPLCPRHSNLLLGRKSLKFVSEEPAEAMFEHGQLAGADLQSLVELITDPGRVSDEVLPATFLLTFRHFTSCFEVFQSLVARFNEGQPRLKGNAERVEEWRAAMQRRALAVVMMWIERYWALDFAENPVFLDSVKAFLTQAAAEGMEAVVQPIVVVIQSHIMMGQKLKQAPLTPAQSTKKQLNVIDVDVQLLAQEMTRIDQQLFKAIHAEDFVVSLWGETPEERKNAHIEAFVDQFNKVSYWVATEIVSFDDVKQRARIAKKFILVAEALYKLRNFNSAMAIMCGLSVSSVQRLKKTFKAIDNKTISAKERLEEVMKSEKNYAEYRAMEKECEKPCVPFFGLYIQDITFMNDGNPRHLDSGLINVSKLRQISDMVVQCMDLQKATHIFAPDTSLNACLLSLQPLNEKALYERSLLVEPREG